MTTKEVFNQITTEHKWYAPFMSAQAAFMFKRRFVKGELKQSTIERTFAKFGYSQEEVRWKRKNISVKIGFIADDIDSNLSTITIDYTKP